MTTVFQWILALPAALVVLGLAACNRVDGPSPKGDPMTPDAARQSLEAARATPAGRLPPADSRARYVGRWAPSETACANEVWLFEANTAKSPRGGSCRFTTVTPVDGGYDVEAQCGRDGVERARRFSLRFAESAQAMLIEGGPAFGDVGVVFCGPPGN
jgi:hypothetical protein